MRLSRARISPDFKLSDGFLLLAQKPEGMRISGKLLGGLGRIFGMQALRLYGFSPQDSPGMENAAPLEPPEPRLEEHYVTLTSNQRAARLALNPWAIMPLVAWAERNPLRPAKASQEQAQVVILFSPNGVYVAGVGVDTPEEIEELTSLGVELVRAQGGKMSACIFCAILNGTVPASFAYRDERVSAFMDQQPVNPGHLLVVPNRHAASLAELEPLDGARMFKVAQRLAAALRRSGLPCAGVNLYLADGAIAGQDIFHIHLHVIPRLIGDDAGMRKGSASRPFPRPAAMDAAAAAIRRALDTGTLYER